MEDKIKLIGQEEFEEYLKWLKENPYRVGLYEICHLPPTAE